MSETGDGLDLAGTAAGNRRLIAIIYADMVGYSRLIGLDDGGTAQRLLELRRALIDPAIHEFGGRVVQTGGDSLLIAFGSIDGAVRCAVKVQRQVPAYDGDQPPDRPRDLASYAVSLSAGPGPQGPATRRPGSSGRGRGGSR